MTAHLGFIVAAFSFTAAVLAATVAAILLDYRVQSTVLDRLTGGQKLTGRDAGPECSER